MSKNSGSQNINATQNNVGIKRLAFTLFFLNMAIAVAGLILLALNRSTPVPESWGFRGFQSLTFFPNIIGSALIIWYHPRHPIAWIGLATGFFGALTGLGEEYAAYTLLTHPGQLPGGEIVAGIANWLWIVSFGLIAIYLPLLFPDGRLLNRSWRKVAWLGAAWIVLGSLRYIIEPGPLGNMRYVSNPFGNEFLAARLSWLSLYTTLGIGLIVMGVAAFSLVLRYRRSGSEVRLQIKWVVFASALMPFAGIIGQFDGWPADLLLILVIAIHPAATSIAILRYRLFDIDIIINRTLVYSMLTASVVTLYVFVVGGLGFLFQSTDSLLTPMLATGLAAVLFHPLRERLQRMINRMMYGERDDPVAVLSKLGAQLEKTGSPEATLTGIVETVALALKLPYAAIELGETGEIVAAYGIPVNEPLRIPMIYQGEPVGQMLAAERAPGEALNPQDQQLLENLARQAGAATHAARLTTDLRRSRQRLVTAREEERRRIRRDLHDGLGPQLASQTLTLAAIEKLIERDPATAKTLIRDLKAQSQEAITDIRNLIYGLRPPSLDDLGLVAALKQGFGGHAHSTAGKVQIVVDVPHPLPPMPAAVELAAYRIAQEAVNNTVKYAHAQNCIVTLRVRQKALSVEITDDGRGLPSNHRSGVGLHTMRERAEELEGRLEVGAGPNGGTRVVATLPVVEP